MKTGIELIAKERQRQLQVKGFKSENDLRYTNNELVDAAMQYLGGNLISCWPWNQSSYKPSPENRIKELQKAGALIAAEIDRLQNSQNELTSSSGLDDGAGIPGVNQKQVQSDSEVQ